MGLHMGLMSPTRDCINIIPPRGLAIVSIDHAINVLSASVIGIAGLSEGNVERDTVFGYSP